MAEMQRDGKAGERKKRLLLAVDNDSQYLYYFGILLQRLDYTMYTTRSAEEALEILDISLPTLVLTEVDLPRLSGIDLLKEMRRKPRTKSIPVLLCSGPKGDQFREACLEQGASAYLFKPIDPDALYAAIQKVTEDTPRSYIRLATHLPVIINGETAQDSFVTAISENGMYASTPRPLPKEAQVSLSFVLNGALLRADGIVLYSSEQGAQSRLSSGMGIRFTGITLQDRSFIKAFIEQQLTEDLPKRRKL